MIILHGTNIIHSRKKLTTLTADFPGEVIRLHGQQVKLTDFKQALESQSLFGQDRLVVVENLFSRRESQEKKAILDYLKISSSEGLIIWEEKKIDGRTLKAFAGQKIEQFDLAPLIFRLVDSLAPGNQKQSLSFLFACQQQDPPEMIFYMLVRQTRFLIAAKTAGKKGLGHLADWQKNKLLNQAEKFSLNQLLVFHKKLLQIDWQQKTGQTSFDLSSQLDLLLASL